MNRTTTLKSLGAFLVPAAIFLSGCPQTCSPASDPGPSATPAAAGTGGSPPAPGTGGSPPAPGTGGSPPAPGAQFSADFDVPDDFYGHFQYGIFPRNADGSLPAGEWNVAEWMGDHDTACHGPDTSRLVHPNRDEMYWWCAPGGDAAKGHLMTSTNTLAYVISAFAPNRALNNVTRVCWDQNTTDLGERKWTQVVVVPEGLYQANRGRLDYTAPDFHDPAGPGHFNVQSYSGFPIFGVRVRGNMLAPFDSNHIEIPSGAVFPAGADKATRYRHCMYETSASGQRRVEITQMLPDGSVNTASMAGSLPDGPVRVIFQDDQYDPPKAPPHAGTSNPFTWHWDNIDIS